ncbi:hypothetical protein C8R45DRAFT_404840 [Mycena sanguinolenta]|nr:hypothetical protein C8R45DRAFT_404840 [Mycena sanguinolenta]
MGQEVYSDTSRTSTTFLEGGTSSLVCASRDRDQDRALDASKWALSFVLLRANLARAFLGCRYPICLFYRAIHASSLTLRAALLRGCRCAEAERATRWCGIGDFFMVSGTSSCLCRTCLASSACPTFTLPLLSLGVHAFRSVSLLLTHISLRRAHEERSPLSTHTDSGFRVGGGAVPPFLWTFHTFCYCHLAVPTFERGGRCWRRARFVRRWVCLRARGRDGEDDASHAVDSTVCRSGMATCPETTRRP